MIMSCRKHNINSRTNETGFTLVELMIAMFVSGLVMAAVGTIYVAQSRSYSERDDIANIQQDLRGALVLLPAEIRQAGCDPEKTGIPSVLGATRNSLRFTMDVRGNAVNSNSSDGDVNDADEDIAYTMTARNIITNATVVADTNGDGIVDSGGANWIWGNNITPSLGRQIANAGGFQPLADHVEAIEFNYLIDDDNNEATPLVPSLAPPNPDRIRVVQISILSRAANPAQGFLNTSTYTTASGVVWNPPNDNFRRRLVVTNIQCRNMGL